LREHSEHRCSLFYYGALWDFFREWESECFSALDSAIDTTLKMADSLISSLTTELEN